MIKPKTQTLKIGMAYSDRPTLNCGDVVARALVGVEPDHVLRIADKIGLDSSKYDRLNNGHVRMIVGGALRKRVKILDGLHKHTPEIVPSGETWLEQLVSMTTE